MIALVLPLQVVLLACSCALLAIALGLLLAPSLPPPLLFAAVVYVFMGWNWYKRLYNGCKNNSTTNFVCFFISFFMHILFFGLGCAGIPDVAMTGYIAMITGALPSPPPRRGPLPGGL